MPTSASWLRTHERFLVRTSWPSCSWVPATPKICAIINAYCFEPLAFGIICCIEISNEYTALCVLPVESGWGELNLLITEHARFERLDQVSRFKVALLEAVFQNHSSVAAPSPLDSMDIFLGFFPFYLVLIFLTPNYIPSDPFSSWSCQVWPEGVHVADVLHFSFYKGKLHR